MSSKKKDILALCIGQLNEQRETVIKRLADLQESKSNETKSSAGDKFETGRAMMQIEEEKLGVQLIRINTNLADLHRIDIEKSYVSATLGSLITTNVGQYFLSVGLGKVKHEGKNVYCISLDSPIGQLLKNKVVGEEIEFNTTKQQILSIE